jgi:hypothetical protein
MMQAQITKSNESKLILYFVVQLYIVTSTGKWNSYEVRKNIVNTEIKQIITEVIYLVT